MDVVLCFNCQSFSFLENYSGANEFMAISCSCLNFVFGLNGSRLDIFTTKVESS